MRAGYNLRNFLEFDPNVTGASTPHALWATRRRRLDRQRGVLGDGREPGPRIIRRGVGQQGNALVSYPFLWDTAQHDKVEWLGIATNGKVGDSLVGLLGEFNGLPRNVGEVLGVFGDFEIADPPSILSGGYRSSVRISKLKELEQLVRTLWSPTVAGRLPQHRYVRRHWREATLYQNARLRRASKILAWIATP